LPHPEYPVHQPGDILGIGLRRDPVAQVEDQRPFAKRVEHFIDAFIQRRTASHHPQRI
jgi:hypothetical protein